MDPNSILNIATAARTDAKRWRNGVISWGELIAKLQTEPAGHKECGGYVLGRLLGERRSKTTIQTRDAVSLDADSHADPQLIADNLDVLGIEAFIHTTFNSAPDDLRLRIIIPLSRSVAPDEYHAIAGTLINLLGADQFDPTSVQPERFMYWPAAQNPEWFQSRRVEGEPADADDLLKDWDPDLTKRAEPRVRKKNPEELGGVVGAFNRAFSIEEAIEAFDLPYEPVGQGRWHLVGARAIAGLNTVAPGLVFSHHVTDPAHGKTCSAFDLVRLHRYGHLDEDSPVDTPIQKLPSHVAMEEEFRSHPKIMGDFLGEDFSDLEDAEAWKLDLEMDRAGRLKPLVKNWDLLRDHDPAFKVVFYNEMTLSLEISADLPWRPLEEGREGFTEVDTMELAAYLERTYRMQNVSRTRVEEVVAMAAHRRRRNPVAEWLQTLVWDGTPRMETCLPGVEVNEHTRLVARKCLVAAVARMLQPGVKWDHSLILHGSEGLGKTHWIERMALGHSDSLGRIGDKDTLLAMQRAWIMISDEGHSLSRADDNAQKEFLTRTADVFRAPYTRYAVAHPRHCVIWGSTNDQVFLRRIEGNRRFLIVRCNEKVDFDALTDEYVEQVWAEAVAAYRAGEKLFLDDEESIVAKTHREEFLEEDVLYGIISEYVDRPVPMSWAEMSPEERAMWLGDPLNRGEVLQDQVCSMQIWCEALGRRRGDHRRGDILDITKALHALPGWRALSGRRRIPGYGPNLVFERMDNIARDLEELL